MKPIIGTNPLSPSVTEVGTCSECPMPAAEATETETSIATIELDVCTALESFSSITYTTNLSQGFTATRFHYLFLIRSPRIPFSALKHLLYRHRLH